MKKMVKTSMVYFTAALIAGVFYREFTKFNQFSGRTALSLLHTHLFVLGMFLFLILAIFCSIMPQILESKKMKKFYVLMNISLPLFVFTLLVRGVAQVLEIDLSSALNASLSGIAGMTHILLTISLGLFFSLIFEGLKKAN
ncbi:DUF2871 domain-containing protein [Traorella massiliensis]|uniref:DUF2871 domain-containing protein n=1 Tax=Traorella massiliensis TaxID=1903263 RepID=UPI00235262D8|nr:DUF2871 domain-containing protein [Traorella massiliensis]